MDSIRPSGPWCFPVREGRVFVGTEAAAAAVAVSCFGRCLIAAAQQQQQPPAAAPAAGSSREQQAAAAAGSRRQPQAAAGSRRQQQAAAGSSRQQQTFHLTCHSAWGHVRPFGFLCLLRILPDSLVVWIQVPHVGHAWT